MQLWIVEHFHLQKKVPVLFESEHLKKSYVMIHYYKYLFVKKKVFNYSELHFSEVTSFKIHTLAGNFGTPDTAVNHMRLNLHINFTFI